MLNIAVHIAISGRRSSRSSSRSPMFDWKKFLFVFQINNDNIEDPEGTKFHVQRICNDDLVTQAFLKKSQVEQVVNLHPLYIYFVCGVLRICSINKITPKPFIPKNQNSYQVLLPPPMQRVQASYLPRYELKYTIK